MGARDPLPTDTAQAAAAVWSTWCEFLRPPPLLSVTEWAEKNRHLSSKDSAEPGPYHVARTPYAAQPQNDLSVHSRVEEVVLMWGAQTSKTTIGSNWLGYLADIHPGPVMIVQPTIDMAKRYSRQRLSPMIEESPALRRKVKENKSRDDANTTLLKEFPGGFMAIAGANSAAGLRSMPVRDLFLDEIDGYPLDVDGEGDPCQLAEARQTTFARRKRLKTSTPTNKGASRIEAAFDASDRNHYHLPCPHCGEHQQLEWGAHTEHGIKWQRDPATGDPLPDTVHYVCRHCGAQILEHHKTQMLAAGRWVAANPGAQQGRVRGYHLSSLYSPLGWLSWRDLAAEWHAAITAKRQGDQSLLRTFINTRLAETFEEAGDRADAHQLLRRAEPYKLATVPLGAWLVTAGADVQGDRIESRAWAWGHGEEAWQVDRQIFYGDPSLPETEHGSPWAALSAWFKRPLQHAAGSAVAIRALAIDTGGHHTQQVYAYAKRHAWRGVLAIKGSSQPGRAVLGRPTEVEVNHQGRRIKHGVKLWMIGTDTAKSLIYGRLRNDKPGPGYVHFSRDLPGDEYDQLTAETRRTVYKKGHAVHEWVKPPSARNEALDCAVYALAAAYWLGLHRFTPIHWQQLEAAIRQAPLIGALALDTETATIEAVAASNEPAHQSSSAQLEPAPPAAADSTTTTPPEPPASVPAPPAPRPQAKAQHRRPRFSIKRW